MPPLAPPVSAAIVNADADTAHAFASVQTAICTEAPSANDPRTTLQLMLVDVHAVGTHGS